MRRAVTAAGATVAGLIMLVRFKTVPDSAHRREAVVPSMAEAAAAELPDTNNQPGTRTVGALQPATQPVRVIVGPTVHIASGNVQVEVTMRGAALVEVAPRQLPESFAISRRISDVVAPALEAEAMATQGGSIDMISGATLTSEAYAESLQAALDRARGITGRTTRSAGPAPDRGNEG